MQVGRTGPAPVWVMILGFSLGQYTEDGHVFLMRKRRMANQIHDSEVHSGVRGIYNSIEETVNWMGNQDPIIRLHIAVMDDVLPKITTKLSLQIEKWEKTVSRRS